MFEWRIGRTKTTVQALLLLLACLSFPFSPAVQAEPGAIVLTVIRQGTSPLTLDFPALKSMPATSIEVQDDSGATAEYTGVSLSVLLAASGVEFGKALRGDRLADYVMVSAADGYRALFAVVEVDSAFRPRPILLCYAKNGLPLPEKEGPLRLVVGDEDRRARWVRQITTIAVGHVP